MSMLYTSNATAEQIAHRLMSAQRIVVTTHSKPDGDAAGSSLAIARALLQVGKSVEVWHIGPFQTWLTEICGDTPVRRFATDAPSPSEQPDAVVITDTGSRAQLDLLVPWLEQQTARTIILDHHLHGDAELAALRLIDTKAAAVTEVVASVIDVLLGLKGDQPLPEPIAQALYLGLATDTGWFKFSNVTPRTLRLAARMIESGVDHALLYEHIQQQDAPARPLLLGRALSSLRYEADAKLATMIITANDLRETNAGQEDTGGFTDVVMSVTSVQAVAVFTDATRASDDFPTTKVSMRSKHGTHPIDVAAVAATLGGGGHARAAGIKVRMSLAQARAAVVEGLTAALRATESQRGGVE